MNVYAIIDVRSSPNHPLPAGKAACDACRYRADFGS
jgi:hypothetical protein